MSALARLWREHRFLVLAFALASSLALFFAVRTLAFWVYWSDPARRDLAPRGWMTVGYVAQSWKVEREAVAEALGLSLGEARGLTLQEIATARGVPLSEIEAAITAAIAASRVGQ